MVQLDPERPQRPGRGRLRGGPIQLRAPTDGGGDDDVQRGPLRADEGEHGRQGGERRPPRLSHPPHPHRRHQRDHRALALHRERRLLRQPRRHALHNGRLPLEDGHEALRRPRVERRRRRRRHLGAPLAGRRPPRGHLRPLRQRLAGQPGLLDVHAQGGEGIPPVLSFSSM